jgi:exonuclease III
MRNLALFIAVCVLCHSCTAVAVEVERRHTHHHRPQHKEHDRDTSMPPPPPGFYEAVAKGEFVPEHEIHSSSPSEMRFMSQRMTDVLTDAPSDSSDIVKAIYSVLATKRDANVEETAQILQKKADALKTQELADQKQKDLQERAAMLTRLQYCLEADKTNQAQVAAAGAAPVNNAAPQQQQQQVQQQQQQQQQQQSQQGGVVGNAGVAAAGGNVAAANGAATQQAAAAAAAQGDLAALKKLQEDAKAKMADLERRDADMKRREAILNERLDAVSAAERKIALSVETPLKPAPVLGNMEPSCPGSCAVKKSCDSCTLDPKCGWCSSTNRCQDVAFDGTSLQNCTGGSFQKLFCSSNQCSQHLTCNSCMADPKCGFCRSTGKCLRGSLKGPDGGSCSNWNFASNLRFLSMNVYGRDVSNYTDRAPVLLKIIQEADAHFVALQEVEDWFLQVLSEAPWAKNYHASDFGSGHAPGGLLILSKIPLASVSYYEKTQPGQVEVDARGRLLVVRPKLGDESFQVASTALDWRDSDNRADTLEFIFSILNTTQDAVVMGDFNFDEGAEPESSMIPASFADVWRSLRGTQPGYTWDPINNAYARASDPKSRPSRIDRQFVSKGWSKLNKVTKIGSPQATPHYALLSEIQMFSAFC